MSGAWHDVVIRFHLTSISLTVESVVDAINDIHGAGFKSDEAAFVLLDDGLFLFGKSLDAVNVGNGLVRSVGGDLSGDRGVHARKLGVDANVGVVDVDLGRSSEVRKTGVVDVGIRYLYLRNNRLVTTTGFARGIYVCFLPQQERRRWQRRHSSRRNRGESKAAGQRHRQSS